MSKKIYETDNIQPEKLHTDKPDIEFLARNKQI